MTMRVDSVVGLFPDLDRTELALWVRERWVEPETARDDSGGADAAWIFDEIDVARVRLIYDLRRALGVPLDALPLILSLLDQVYELRCAMRQVESALAGQPADVRAAIRRALQMHRR